MDWIIVCEWIGSVTGVVAALALAWGGRAWLIRGFWLFTFSDLVWAATAIAKTNVPLLSMQVIFALINMFGIYRLMRNEDRSEKHWFAKIRNIFR